MVHDDISNESPDRVRRHWLPRLLEVGGTVMLVALGVGAVAQAFLWQLPDDAPAATAPSQSQLPETADPLAAAADVFDEFGASVVGTTVTFPDAPVTDAAAAFDCTGWSVVLQGFHSRFVLVGACDDVTVAGTHVDAYIEGTAALTMEGPESAVAAGAIGTLTMLGAHTTVIADAVEVLAGDASFPHLVLNQVGDDQSDFTFGTAAVAAGLADDQYVDSFSPELLRFESIPLAADDVETRIVAADTTEHACDGERLVVRDRAPDAALLITGECDTVIVADREQIEIERASTVVVLEGSTLVELGDIQTLVVTEVGVGDSAASIEALAVGGSMLALDADSIAAIVTTQSASDVTWRSGAPLSSLTAPEGATGFSGP